MPSMGTVHDLIEARGKAGTLAFDFDRPVVEAAAAYMADEDAGVGFLYSGWCQAALPHRRLANDKGWQIEGERVTLIERWLASSRQCFALDKWSSCRLIV